MTPQERQLIADLFDKLAQLEANPRDPEAEREIAAGLARAPHAAYPLVQTVLVQDEALKAANARIQELQSQFGEGEAARSSGGFLDSMRNALLGAAPRRAGAVPSVRQAAPSPGYGTGTYASAQGSYGSGPSFLGTAAAAAAGMVGGGLLLEGIRSMLGSHSYSYGPFAGTFDHLSGHGPDGWDGTTDEVIETDYDDPQGGDYDDASDGGGGFDDSFGGDGSDFA